MFQLLQLSINNFRQIIIPNMNFMWLEESMHATLSPGITFITQVFIVFWFPSSCFCSLPHDVETSFSRLLRHIMSASYSLDLCVFAFSNMDLCRAVLALHKKGINIRVLTDKDYAAITGSQIGVLRKAGKDFICICSYLCASHSSYYIYNSNRVTIFVRFVRLLLWTNTRRLTQISVNKRCSYSVLGLPVSLSLSLTGLLSGE